jgi:hypothetical protein
MTDAISDFLADRIADPHTSWSIGSFGAIAEFVRDPDEPARFESSGTSLAVVTGRGGIRITPNPQPRPFASESAVGRGWNHRVSLCLPASLSTMGRRGALTELGPDAHALREEERDDVLFDLGLGCMQVDALIRTRDPDLIARLRSDAGRSLFAPGNSAMMAILGANPHRVFVSRLGRVEVFQPIPPADGKSPEGPHTHVLPKLLAHGRTHSATEPVPDGLVPCAHCYPPHPAKDALGQARPFDPGFHASFETLLRSFGDPATVALKHQVTTAVAAGGGPDDADIPNSRFARAAVRVALRQMRARGECSPALDAWASAFDRIDEVDFADDNACA